MAGATWLRFVNRFLMESMAYHQVRMPADSIPSLFSARAEQEKGFLVPRCDFHNTRLLLIFFYVSNAIFVVLLLLLLLVLFIAVVMNGLAIIVIFRNIAHFRFVIHPFGWSRVTIKVREKKD